MNDAKRRSATLLMSVAALGLGAAFAPAARAHNYHMGLTDISFNPNTGNTEIVHTYTAHDIDALLAHVHQRQFDLGLKQDQAVFQRYLDRRFVLRGANGKPLVLKWVGMQADARNVTVYQEIEKTPLPRGALLFNGMLSDFLPTQINMVNIGNGSAVSTLTFTAKNAEQRLPPP